MIKTFPYNAINFSNDFNRNSNVFPAHLQRVRNIIAPVTGVLSFEYLPVVMPDAAPDAHVGVIRSDGVTVETIYNSVIELTDRFVYIFAFSSLQMIAGACEFFFYVDGDSDVIYSEKCQCFNLADFPGNNLVRVIAYNYDAMHGYISSTYPACGFFKVSELGRDVFGNDKIEYKRSYGRNKILSSENYIKTTLTFLKLSMYQQNLLKWLCNCEVMSINGVTYNLIGEFSEENKDNFYEVCDLKGTFVRVDGEISTEAASTPPEDIEPVNIFM